jgi:hypothetical protein
MKKDGRFTGEGRKVGHGKITDAQIAAVKRATGYEPDIPDHARATPKSEPAVQAPTN